MAEKKPDLGNSSDQDKDYTQMLDGVELTTTVFEDGTVYSDEDKWNITAAFDDLEKSSDIECEYDHENPSQNEGREEDQAHSNFLHGMTSDVDGVTHNRDRDESDDIRRKTLYPPTAPETRTSSLLKKLDGEFSDRDSELSGDDDINGEFSDRDSELSGNDDINGEAKGGIHDTAENAVDNEIEVDDIKHSPNRKKTRPQADKRHYMSDSCHCDDISDSSMDERAGAEIQDDIDGSENDMWTTACFVEIDNDSDSERADRTEDQLQNATSDKGYVEEDQSQTNIHYTIATGAGEGAGNLKRFESDVNHACFQPPNAALENETSNMPKTRGDECTSSDCDVSDDGLSQGEGMAGLKCGTAVDFMDKEIHVDDMRTHSLKRKHPQADEKYFPGNKSSKNICPPLNAHRFPPLEVIKCKHCTQTFSSSKTLQNHMTVLHRGEKPFQCDQCEARAYLPGTIRVHKRDVHGMTENSSHQPHSLDATSVVTGDNNERDTKMESGTADASVGMEVTGISNQHGKEVFKRTGSGKKPSQEAESFKCQQCPLIYVELKFLNEHVNRVHGGKKEFKCDVCGKCLSSSRNLRRHTKHVHSNESFSCEICQKKFRSKALREKHMTTHSEEKPHKCVTCAKSFKTSSERRQHERSHLSHGYCQCDVTGCSKTFKIAESLNIHKSAAHGENARYQCAVCSHYFYRKADWERHKKTHKK